MTVALTEQQVIGSTPPLQQVHAGKGGGGSRPTASPPKPLYMHILGWK